MLRGLSGLKSDLQDSAVLLLPRESGGHALVHTCPRAYLSSCLYSLMSVWHHVCLASRVSVMCVCHLVSVMSVCPYVCVSCLFVLTYLSPYLSVVMYVLTLVCSHMCLSTRLLVLALVYLHVCLSSHLSVLFSIRHHTC